LDDFLPVKIQNQEIKYNLLLCLAFGRAGAARGAFFQSVSESISK
jgi:hypothetical protein